MRKQQNEYNSIVEKMGQTIRHRGPDDAGTYIGEHVAFAHARLAVMDPEGGIQPMVYQKGESQVSIIYNGELYNTNEIKQDLLQKGYVFKTTSDTEVILLAYVEYGEQCVEQFNGIYAFAIWDSVLKTCFMCRDRFGIKPFFYYSDQEQIIFASEIKGIFANPDVKPEVDKYGLCEIFGLGPARSPGCGVFKGIHEIPPGYCARIDYSGMKLFSYWELKAQEHEETYEETVAHTRELLLDAIKRQLVSDVPICTLLSGGIDSSIVSAVASQVKKEEGKILDTYSFDFLGNNRYFKASDFQPSQDRPFVDLMVQAIQSNHHYLECDNQNLFEELYPAMKAKDLPGMADVDSSLLYFCRKIKEKHTVCLSGECADEIFGGYPWFRNPMAYSTRSFPWSSNLQTRLSVLTPNLREELHLEEYVSAQYEKTIKATPKLEGETVEASRQREISYLNIRWFMTTLLDRKDRMTMASGLEVRVPFADHRLVQYVYNVPWDYKFHNQTTKGLLRDASVGLLPQEVLWRKKSPYPKTYHPQYESFLKNSLWNILSDSQSPIQSLVHTQYLKNLLKSNNTPSTPWFGQLMSTPQLYAYLIQINAWMEQYQIHF